MKPINLLLFICWNCLFLSYYASGNINNSEISPVISNGSFDNFLLNSKENEEKGRFDDNSYIYWQQLSGTETMYEELLANGGQPFFNTSDQSYKDAMSMLVNFNGIENNDIRVFVLTGRYYLPAPDFASNEELDLIKLKQLADQAKQPSTPPQSFSNLMLKHLEKLDKAFPNQKIIVLFGFEFVWTSVNINDKQIIEPASSDIYSLTYLSFDKSLNESFPADWQKRQINPLPQSGDWSTDWLKPNVEAIVGLLENKEDEGSETLAKEFEIINSKDLKSLAEASRKQREESYLNDVESFSKRLKNLIISGQYYDVSEDIAKNEKEIIVVKERLKAYASAYKNFYNEDRKILIVSGKISYFIDQEGWDKFAEDVANSTDNFNKDNYKLICIPYITREEAVRYTTAKLDAINISHVFPGTNFNSSKPVFSSLYKYFLDVYRNTPKPYIRYTYLLKVDGTLEYVRISTKAGKIESGRSYIYDLELYADKKIGIALDFYDLQKQLQSAKGNNSQILTIKQNNIQKAIRYRNLLLDETRVPEYDRIIDLNTINVKESYIEGFHEIYILDELAKKYPVMVHAGVISRQNINKEILYEVPDAVLQTIDFFSFIASFVGFDVAFDVVGATYSVVKGNYEDGSIYAASSFLPFANGATSKNAIRYSDDVLKNIHKLGGKDKQAEILRSVFKSNDDRVLQLLNNPEVKNSITDPYLVARIDFLDKTSANHLLDDFIDNPDLINYFAKNNELLDSWVVLKNTPDFIRKSPKSLNIVSKWLDEGIEATFETVPDGARILNKKGDEIGKLIKEGADEVLEISDDFIIDVASSASKKFDGITIKSNTGETFINVGFVKDADGSLSFVEDVISYGSTAVQNTIKKRANLRAALKGIKASEDAHHLFPVQLLKENQFVKKAVEGGFEFNTGINGMAIEKFVKKTGAGRHGPHPEYTQQINAHLDWWAEQSLNINGKIIKNKDLSPQQTAEYMRVIAEDLKATVSGSSSKINYLDLGLNHF